jgi:hypothetical protein
MSGSDERRSYFRVDDEVLLDYRPLLNGEDINAPPDSGCDGADAFALRNHLATLSRRVRAPLGSLRCRQPELADVLAALDEKIEAIAVSVLAQQLDATDTKARRVSLSAGGVAFHAAEALSECSALELRMVLLPSFTTVSARVMVERCTRHTDFRDGFPYRIAVAYRGMREEQRALLIKHALARQVADRQD